MKAEILDVRFIHEGWTRFGLARVRLVDGEVVERALEHHGDSVGVLPFDPDRRVAALIREMRVPMLYAAGEQLSLEAPAGILDDGSPAEDGRREVLEEVGIRLGELEPVATAWSSPGISTERIHLYLAPYRSQDRVEAGGGAEGEHENIRVREIPLAELGRMADAGELTDLKTLALVLTLRSRRPDLFADR